ncbi:uncharacterized protein LOC126095679 [Schistocerca cancellata]|uniref:uncharacterized protein LOC126095679 n=1 Tax=Schistocerca cancellata TaxID=274614 RepID=UPI00211971E0|nr:uncharacterized protein LOC126095679 [Schistocerca cancellata]
MADLPDQLMQQLYLLEVMVDQVSLATDELPGCPCEPITNLSVRVKFFDFPCLDIRQAEFGYHERRGDFSSGKSLLFPMDPLDLVRALQYFPLAVSVVQPRPKAPLPRVLGVCTVTMPDQMVDAVRRARVCCAHQQEAVLKEDFQLVQLTGQPAGSLRLFVRLSCLGQTLVTEFDADSTVLSLNTADTSPACPGCFSRAEPTDPRASDVYPAPPLLSDHEPCCPKECQCDKTKRLPVLWKQQAACECTPPAPRSFLRLIIDKMAADAAAKAAAEPSPAQEGREGAGDAAGQPPAEPEPELPDQVPAVRYDTTGVLSPAARGQQNGEPTPALRRGMELPPHPAVRYDTTSILSPAGAGAPAPRTLLQPTPPVRYDTTGALSAAARCPPVRYDTTGALSRASRGTLVAA